jgi:hypothetical protein
MGSGDLNFGTPPGQPGPSFETTGLSRFHPQQGGATDFPDLSQLQLHQLAQAEQQGGPWQQQPDAASQALQARMFAYQQHQHQQVRIGHLTVIDSGGSSAALISQSPLFAKDCGLFLNSHQWFHVVTSREGKAGSARFSHYSKETNEELSHPSDIKLIG